MLAHSYIGFAFLGLSGSFQLLLTPMPMQGVGNKIEWMAVDTWPRPHSINYLNGPLEGF